MQSSMNNETQPRNYPRVESYVSQHEIRRKLRFQGKYMFIKTCLSANG